MLGLKIRSIGTEGYLVRTDIADLRAIGSGGWFMTAGDSTSFVATLKVWTGLEWVGVG
jgi:hypothetical protein